MKIVFYLIAVLVLFGLALTLPLLIGNSRDETRASRRAKKYARVMSEGVVLNQHGVYGVDFVRCSRCAIEKLTHGPLTFGAVNVLVLDDLRIVIPPSTNKSDATSAETSPRELAERMGLDGSFLKANGAGLRFSRLRINGLSVSCLRDGKAVEMFTARQGEAERDGLHLQNCVIIMQNSNHVSRALLQIKPHLCLEWEGGSMDLETKGKD